MCAALLSVGDHSIGLSDACNRAVSASLARFEQSANLTGALLGQTLHTVQDNSSNVQIAHGHFESTLPILDALAKTTTLPQIRTS